MSHQPVNTGPHHKRPLIYKKSEGKSDLDTCGILLSDLCAQYDAIRPRLLHVNLGVAEYADDLEYMDKMVHVQIPEWLATYQRTPLGNQRQNINHIIVSLVRLEYLIHRYAVFEPRHNQEWFPGQSRLSLHISSDGL